MTVRAARPSAPQAYQCNLAQSNLGGNRIATSVLWSRDNQRVNDSLTFTRKNRSVHGLSKWSAKFRTGKSLSFAFCTNRSIYRKTTANAWNSVTKMALKKWNTNFRLEHSVQKNRSNLSMFRCSRKFSAGTTKQTMFHLLSNQIFRKRFVNSNNQ